MATRTYINPVNLSCYVSGLNKLADSSGIKSSAVFIGPIIATELYFVTRQPLPTARVINPFASLDSKFWMNFSLLYVTFILATVCIQVEIFKSKGLNAKRIVAAVVSPSAESEFRIGEMMKAGITLPCLMAFAFWTFETLYGVDLQAVLVKQTFEREVNSWDDIKFFETQFVFAPWYFAVQ